MKKQKLAQKGLPAIILVGIGVGLFLVLSILIGGRFLSYQVKYQKSRQFINSLSLPSPAPSVKLPVKTYVYRHPGTACWLVSGAGLAHYLEPEINFYQFVLNGGPTKFLANRNEGERYGVGLNWIHAFTNLGYTVYRASTNPVRPPRSIYPDIDPPNFIYFKSYQEELEFMKKLLSAGIVPILGVNRRRLGFNDDGGDFAVVSGYNDEGVWLNSPDPALEDPALRQKAPLLDSPTMLEARLVDYQTFRKAFKGDHQLFWVKKTSQRKTDAEVYQENKKDAQEAAANIRKTITYLKSGGQMLLFTQYFNFPSAIALYRDFQGKGNNDLANQYLQIAKTYDQQFDKLGPEPNVQLQRPDVLVKLLTELEPLIGETALMWP